MKRLMMTALASSLAIAVATPASAVVITSGGAAQTPTLGQPAGPGTQVQFGTFSGVAQTFAATIRYAVYLNTGNTYDFYFQVSRTGAGSNPASSGNFDNPITMLTVSSYSGYSTDVYYTTTDFDGAGGFIAANNPGTGGFTTTASKNPSGSVVSFDFGTNFLEATETSAIYIIRTNATNYNFFGSFGVIDGSTLSGVTYQPAAGVPEPATWGMMIAGFGLMGGVLRRRKTTVAFA